MIPKWSKRMSLLLAGLLLAGSLVACANSPESPEKESATVGASGSTDTAPESEGETVDVAQSALDALEHADYGKRTFTILGEEPYCSEIMPGEDDISEVVNNALHVRNTLWEEKCNLTLACVPKDNAMLQTMVRNEASAPTRDFQFIDTNMSTNATLATGANLYDYKALDVDLSGPWWDTGTANFVLEGGVYFMSGSVNTDDDHFTYVLIFNKDMQKTYANTVPNPYDTVRNWEWTLDHFHSIIQNVAKDSDGDGKWTGKDTYGFISLGEFSNSFFLGCDLRYVLNNESVDEPQLFLTEKSQMEKAQSVIDLARRIYHENHATYLEAGDGYDIFLENRGLFLGHVSGILSSLNASMDGDFGVLPVPKYDKEQEFYRSYITAIGSSFSIPNSIPEEDLLIVGDIIEAYAIYSHQHLMPAYYDTVVTSRNVRDSDSAEMLNIVFQNRVYDMAFYFDLGMGSLVTTCVNEDRDSFQSSYASASKNFSRRLTRVLGNLRK